jgi:hypothetical protein
MTGKTDFSEEEWEVILKGPPSAGMIVITAQRGGTFRESFSMAKAYGEARQQHGDSELLDEIASTKPEIDHTRYHSPEDMQEHALQHLRDSVALVDAKATEQERSDYRSFVVQLAERVAGAHREAGKEQDPVSDSERGAIDSIRQALG